LGAGFSEFVAPTSDEIKPPGSPSFSLGPASLALTSKSINRIEEAIAKKMLQGPEERAEFYEKIRHRLATTVLRLRETKGNLSTTASEVERETTRIRDAIAEARAIIDAANNFFSSFRFPRSFKRLHRGRK
jgi:hypothetical protein